MSEIKLFDIKGFDWKGEQGSFRTIQVFQCPVCKWVTNQISITRDCYANVNVRAKDCPHSHKKWHGELREKIEWLHAHPHPRSYKEELQGEIAWEQRQGGGERVVDLEPEHQAWNWKDTALNLPYFKSFTENMKERDVSLGGW
jgi:hypothetical protein